MARNMRFPLWLWLACCLGSCGVCPAVASPASHTMRDVMRHFLHQIAQSDDHFDKLANRMRNFWARPLLMATACSGTDAVVKLMSEWDGVMRDLLGLKESKRSAMAPFFSQVFACESDDDKINFHSDQFGRLGVMFRDVRDLGNPMGASDVHTGIMTMIPWACLIIAGFSCKDASMQNARKRHYSDVIRTGARSTGSTWHGLLAYLDSVRPWAMLAENVEGLMSQVPIMKQQVESLGYLFHVLRLNAQDFCLPQKRPRVFFVIVMDIGEAIRFNDIDVIVSMLRTMPLDIRGILEKAGHTQPADAMRADGDAAPRRSGVRVSRNQIGARDEWVNRHREIFRDLDLSFVIPTDQELGTTAPDGVLELPLRERSIVQFWTLQGCVSGFLDVSESLERRQAVHENCLSCITTSATHFDFVEQKTVPLRALWDVQGLDWDAWTDLEQYNPRLIKDLLANAFSIPTIASVLIAMFTVLPWPSSAQEQEVWMRRGASGPPPTPPGSSSQSESAGVRVSGCSGGASDDDGDDGVGLGSQGSDSRCSSGGSHCADVSDACSFMNPASGQQTGEDTLEADMRDLELLASLG